MKSVISKMVGNLKVKINTTEKVLGDKLKVLDRDNDGQISYDEIRSVVSTVMRKGAATEEHVAQLFDALDSNKDGKGWSRAVSCRRCSAYQSCALLSQCLWLSSSNTSTGRKRAASSSSWRYRMVPFQTISAGVQIHFLLL